MPTADSATTPAPAQQAVGWPTRLAALVALAAMFWIDNERNKLGRSAAATTSGYDSEGAVWNKRLAPHTRSEHGSSALLQAQERCGQVSLVFDPTQGKEIVDAAMQRLVGCGSVVLGPGLLPKMTPQILDEMAQFSDQVLDQGSSGAWEAGELLPLAHSDRRGDTWPPFHASAPFGERLLRGLTDLGPLLLPLLGDDTALDFVSVLYAKPGATNQGWHAEGRDPEALAEADGRLANCILKVQVLLHTVSPDMGMIHFLSHNGTNSSLKVTFGFALYPCVYAKL
jgi:hypothetical protein